MTLLPPGVKVHLAFGYIDMRKGIDGLAMLVQGVLQQDPFSGHLFVFRGRKANLIKIVYWDGTGLCLFTKRLEHGVFLWPPHGLPTIARDRARRKKRALVSRPEPPVHRGSEHISAHRYISRSFLRAGKSAERTSLPSH